MERNRSTYSDDELINLLQKDEQWAFDIIYNEHWEYLYNHAYKRIGVQEIVEDALQNVFSRIWIKRKSLQIFNIRAYLTTSIMHECIHILAKSRQFDRFYQNFEQVGSLLSTQMDSIIIQKEILEVAYKYAETLPAKKQKLFILHLKGYDTKEISVHLKLSRKTVQNQLGMILKTLKNSSIIHHLLLFEILRDIF